MRPNAPRTTKYSARRLFSPCTRGISRKVAKRKTSSLAVLSSPSHTRNRIATTTRHSTMAVPKIWDSGPTRALCHVAATTVRAESALTRRNRSNSYSCAPAVITVRIPLMSSVVLEATCSFARVMCRPLA